MDGANPPKAGREGTLERGQEMARRPPPLPGQSARQPAANSGGTTDKFLFALSPSGSGRFFVSVAGLPEEVGAHTGAPLPDFRP